jgi:hypothetical protein
VYQKTVKPVGGQTADERRILLRLEFIDFPAFCERARGDEVAIGFYFRLYKNDMAFFWGAPFYPIE